MAQNSRRDVSDRIWLEKLIESFEKTAQPTVRSVPCSPKLLKAAQHHLANAKRGERRRSRELTEAD